MLDIKFIRDNADKIKKAITDKRMSVVAGSVPTDDAAQVTEPYATPLPAKKSAARIAGR